MSSSDPLPRERPSALFLLSGLLLAIALLLGMAREQHWGQKRFGLMIRSHDASGLRSGMEVRIAGLPVGRVTALELGADAMVAVEIQVEERYRHLVGPRSRAYRGQEGLLGDSFLAITPDTSSDLPVRPTPVTLAYEQPVSTRELIRDWQQTRASLQRNLDNTALLTGRDVPRTLAELRRSLADVSRLSNQVHGQAAATGPAIRHSLNQLDQTAVAARVTAITARQTASSARRAADEASLVLGSSRPLLLQILRDLQAVSGSSERLLRLLLGSEALAPAGSAPTAGVRGDRPRQP